MLVEPGDSETKVSSKDVNKDGVSGIDGPDVISTNHFVDHKNGDLQHLSSVNITMIVMIVMIVIDSHDSHDSDGSDDSDDSHW